ncbi:MAG TPA: hypothetical protein VNO17_00615 [Actinomycetota bacterium]|nr:hypothetical protein [Actinomycetota bacterium]
MDAVKKGRGPARTAALIAIGAIVGYLAGPPIAEAASSLVTIKDPRSSSKARVTRGNLWVDASGSVVLANGFPYGQVFVVLGSGTGSGTVVARSRLVVVSGVAASGPLELQADVDCDGVGGDRLWVAGSETSHAFEGGIVACGPLVATDAGGSNWSVYGAVVEGTGSPSLRQAVARVREAARATPGG